MAWFRTPAIQEFLAILLFMTVVVPSQQAEVIQGSVPLNSGTFQKVKKKKKKNFFFQETGFFSSFLSLMFFKENKSNDNYLSWFDFD